METQPLSDIVSDQYERWMYPKPIMDLPAWLANNWQWFDPSHAHRQFWPDRDYKSDMEILIAGCGTNQAAVIAYTNPDARITAIDVSQPSLDHEKYLKGRYGLKNLELRLLPIEDVASLNRDFDLIITTGVLHHLADPGRGMTALAGCLRQDGVIAAMLYARFGRIGVEMMQSVFRELGLRQDDASVAMVKQAITALPQDHPVKPYLSLAPDLQFDAGLVDTFLHGRDRSFTIADCIELATGAGLVFQDLFMKAPYYPPASADNAFYHSVAALPVETQWSIMERINFRNACHFFTACRADRPVEHYRIDFTSKKALSYIPTLKYRCALNGQKISRPGWFTNLDVSQLAFAELMDGQRSIGDIAAVVAARGMTPMQSVAGCEAVATTFFQSLWQTDFIAISLA